MPHREKRKTHWDSVYESRAEQDQSWFEPAPNVSFELVRLSSNGLRDAIVDVGGGNSHLVDLLLKAGFSNVRVLDVSSRAIEMAQARLGQRARDITWIESDVLEWNGPRDVDIWHDRATYHFLTDPADRALYAEVAARTVVPSGTLIVETFAQEGPRSCSGCRFSVRVPKRYRTILQTTLSWLKALCMSTSLRLVQGSFSRYAGYSANQARKTTPLVPPGSGG